MGSEIEKIENAKSHEVVSADSSILDGPFSNRLLNPDGTPRGGISIHAKVADTAFVSIEANILAGASVLGGASVEGKSVIGAGATIKDNAVIHDSEIVAVSPENSKARIIIGGYALVENFRLEHISMEAKGDAWIPGRYEATVRTGTGSRSSITGGYKPNEILEGVTYSGSSSGTGKADMLTSNGVQALYNWLTSLPVDHRRKYVEEIEILRERTGEDVSSIEMELPLYRFVSDGNHRYVVPVETREMHRMEDLLKSGASFPEVARLYDLQQETLVMLFEHHLGYNPFSGWDDFVKRPMQVEYSLLVSRNRDLVFRKWKAISEDEQKIWDEEISDISKGFLFELDKLPKVRHFSILDRPSEITWLDEDN
jgi:hypothetical protein